jgi:hypothetical protein
VLLKIKKGQLCAGRRKMERRVVKHSRRIEAANFESQQCEIEVDGRRWGRRRRIVVLRV